MRTIGPFVLVVLAIAAAYALGVAPRVQGTADQITAGAQRAICPSPVMAADRTLSCDGAAVTTVRRPDGRVDVVTTSPPAPAAPPRR